MFRASQIDLHKSRSEITGGSGKYAGAHGSFVSKEPNGKGANTVTVTLVE